MKSFDWLDDLINHQVAGPHGFKITRALASAMLTIVQAYDVYRDDTTVDNKQALDDAFLDLILMKPRNLWP